MALTVQNVELGQHYPFGYGDGAKPGFQCKVSFKVADYQMVMVTLPDDATKTIIAAIVAEATKLLTVDVDAIDVAGSPGAPKPEREADADFAAPIAEAA